MKLDKANVEDIFNLTAVQKGMLFHYLNNRKSNEYIEQLVVKLLGEIDIEKFKESWNKVFNDNEVLRTIFVWEKVSNPIQVVLKKINNLITFSDMSNDYNKEVFVNNYISEDKNASFNLNESSIRIKLFKMEKNEYIMIVTNHHIIYDGWSNGIILREFFDNYVGNNNNTSKSKFKEFVREIEIQDKNKQKKYWNKYFEGIKEKTELSIKKKKNKSLINNLKKIRLNKQQLLNFCEQHNITLATLIYASYGILLSEYNNTNDVMFGTTVSGRNINIKNIENAVGLFINTIPLRIKVDYKREVLDYLQEVQSKLNERVEYENTPINEIIKENKAFEGELFDSIIVIENYPLKAFESNKLKYESFSMSEKSNYELTIGVGIYSDIEVEFNYNEGLFNKNSIERLANHFSNIINNVVNNCNESIEELSILSKEEEENILYKFNKDISNIKLEHFCDSFNKIVKKYPDNIAIKYGDISKRYSELDINTDKIANYLINNGIQKGERIGLIFNKSCEMVEAIIGVIKAGAVYVPIDPSYPINRKEHIINDSNIKLIITNNDVDNIYCKAVDINDIYNKIREINKFDIEYSLSDLFCIIYTSGTTGKPKGVMLSHKNLSNLLEWFTDTYKINNEDKILHLTNYVFDVSIEDIFCTLANGATINIPKEDIMLSSDVFSNYINNNEISIINFIPTVLKEMLDNSNSYKKLRVVICGGERLDDETKDRLINNGYTLYNNYGPAEATVDSLFNACNEEKVTLGRPIVNVKCLVVNKHNNLCPIGVKGELYITGLNVSNGYINNAELTNKNFINMKWFDNSIFYKTGDIVQWTEDGKIKFIGREDHQVKINGKRIEIEEISNVIRSREEIIDNVITVVNNKIVAYIVTKDNNLDKLKDYLHEVLPQYMIPNSYIVLDKIPLTSIGKIDYRALPKPKLEREEKFKVPTNEVEELIRTVWADVFKLDKNKISITDNFFELGGDSIISIQIIGRLTQKGIKVTVKDIFECENIERLSKKISLINKNKNNSGVKLTGEILLLPIQQWFFESNFDNYNYWNQSVLLECSEKIDMYILEEALKIIEDKFDIFKIKYTKKDNKWVQEYKENTNKIDLVVNDIKDFEVDKFKELVYEESNTLDITNGKIMKLVYFNNLDKLFVCMHHLVVDGFSWRIILEEINKIYVGLKNNNYVDDNYKTASLKECSILLRDKANIDKFKKDIDYWTSNIPNEIKEFNCDKDGVNNEKSTEIITVNLDKEYTNRLLHEIYEVNNTQLKDLLLSALGKTITKYNGETIVDIEGHGRDILSDDMNISRTLGWFTSVYPIYFDKEYSQMNYKKVIEETKGKLRRIPNNGITYGLLKSLCNDNEIKNKINNLKNAEICFNYLGQIDQTFSKDSLFRPIDNIELPNYDKRNKRCYKIEIDCVVINEELKINWKYSKDNYHNETIVNLAEEYVTNLKEVLNNCKYISLIPEDFPNTNISKHKLDELVEKYDDISDIYGVSPVQESMIFHSVYSPDSSVAVEQTVFRIEGNLDIDAFKKTWEIILNRHEGLRASYHWQNLKKPIQVIHDNLKVSFDFKDWTDEKDYESKLEKFISDDRNKGFVFENPPLLRISVIKSKDNIYDILWTYHHIQMDGWCLSLIMQELDKYYKILVNNEKIEIQVETPFKDYITWINNKEESEIESFWKEKLKGFIKPTLLSSVLDNNAVENDKPYDVLEYEVNEQLKNKINEYTKKNKITLSTFLQGVWALVMNRYVNEKDIVFGVTSSGRPIDLKNSDSIIGCFMNTVPFRVNVTEEMEISQYMSKIQKDYVEELQYDYTALSTIRRLSEIPRDTALYDLYDSMVIVENYPFEEAVNNGFGGLKGSCLQVEEQLDYPCTLYCNVHGQFNFKILFDTSFFGKEIINNILEHFIHIINEIVVNNKMNIKDIAILPDNQYNKIVNVWNKTKMEYPTDKSYIDIFNDVVKKYGNSIALMQDDNQLTYNDLNMKADIVARKLKSLGVGKEDLIAVYIGRELDLIVSIYGVLKAGAAFVPIDITYPVNRIKSMVKSSKIKYLLTKKNFLDEVEQYNKNYICIEEIENNIEYDLSKDIISQSDSAYTIFTSGTTGEPKGIIVPHRCIVSHSIDMIHKYELTEKDRVLQFSSITFDISLEQILSTLVSGATLVLREDKMWSPIDLSKKCKQYKLSVINLPTAYWSEVTYEWSKNEKLIPEDDLRLMIVGGEQMLIERVRLWKDSPLNNIKLFNAYGPAETCMTSTLCNVTEESLNNKVVPVGKPLANRKIYILDEQLKPVPMGVIGELYINGIVAREYLDNEELTKKSFIKDFISNDNNIMYRTGDIGRFRDDGNIELIGRKDKQVKIRSHRIEISEVEKVLYNNENVKDVCIEVKEDKNKDKFLVAYVVPKENSSIEKDKIKTSLENNLPNYMVPKYIVDLEKLPITSNGKIDRKALPDIFYVFDDSSEVDDNCNDELERKLKNIWKEILDVLSCRRSDNFFEFGGDSIKAMQLVSSISLDMNIDISLERIFMYPTFEKIYENIKDISAKGIVESIPKSEKKEYYNTSEAQKRMYLLNQLDTDSLSYNMPYVIELNGKTDKEKIKYSLLSLIQRHESLRTNYLFVNGELMQKINEINDFELIEVNAKENRIKDVIKEYSRTFKLDSDLLFRAVLINIADDRAVLFIDMHHIACDGISIGIIIKDFISIYSNNNLKNKSIDYKDFAEFNNKYLSSDKFKEEENYWLEKYKDNIPVLNLPYDYYINSNNHIGSMEEFKINKDLTNNIKMFIKDKNITMFTFLLSAFNILLSKYSMMEDIIVGTPVSGRESAEVKDIVGIFINTIAIRTKPEKQKKFNDYINEVSSEVINDLSNQQYPFSKLIEKLNDEGNLDSKDLYNVMFAYYNIDIPKIELNHLVITERKYNNNTSKFDLELKAYENDDELLLNFEYCVELFSRNTIMRIINNYKEIIQQVLNNEVIAIKDIKITNNINNVYHESKLEAGHRFEEELEKIVNKYPNNIAFVQGDRRLTYEELNNKANILAKLIMKNKVEYSKVVAIAAESSIEFFISVIAAMKANCTYIPVDISLSKEQVQFMLQESNCGLILCNIDYENEILPVIRTDKFDYDDNDMDINGIKKDNNTAYIIYTSGTTGKPKGVMINHESLINYSKYISKRNNIKCNDKSILVSSVAFDLGYTNIYPLLLSGGQINILKKDEYCNIRFLLNYIEKNNITTIKMTPTLFNVIVDDPYFDESNLSTLKYIILGGEKLDYNSIIKYNNKFKETKLINHYGPTETTIGCCTFNIDINKLNVNNINTIGKPIDNMCIKILDENLEDVLIGVAGEIYIGGKGLCRGYINNNLLNKDKFIKRASIDEEIVLYKSGDIGKYNNEGNIIFLGRSDNQIKINGYRVELDEVKLEILEDEKIEQAIVVIRENVSNEKVICAYFTAKQKINCKNITKRLKNNLISYKVPSVIQQIEEIPMNNNGKIDFGKLPKINLDILHSNEYVEPRNRKEQILSQIYKEILYVDKVGIDDDFFELGGNSLKVIKVVSLAQTRNLKIYPRDLLNNHTIRELEEYVQEICDYENNRVYNKHFKVNDKYPYYYSCLTGCICEALRYNNNVDIRKSFIDVGELGKGIFTFGVTKMDKVPYNYEYLELPIYHNPYFEFELRKEGVELAINSYKDYETMEAELMDVIKQNKVIITSGTTYYLPYTNEYKIDINKWRKDIETRTNSVLREFQEASTDHIFILLDKINDDFLIYDTSFEYFGLVNNHDFRKALEGIRNMEELGDCSSKEIVVPLSTISIESRPIDKARIKEIALNILKNLINVNMSNKNVVIENTKGMIDFKVGIESILDIKALLSKELSKNSINKNIIELIKECFNKWKAKILLLRDFVCDIGEYVQIDNIVKDKYNKIIEICEETVENYENIETDLVHKYIENTICDIDLIYDSIKKTFILLKNV